MQGKRSPGEDELTETETRTANIPKHKNAIIGIKLLLALFF
jgi:hypothetical protein